MENHPEQPDKAKRELEDDQLKVGYMSLYSQRYPINENIENCESPESAYLFFLEQEYLEIPRNLTFPHLTQDIAQAHRERLNQLWQKVIKHKQDLDTAVEALKLRWENPPRDMKDKYAQKITEAMDVPIAKEFQEGLTAIVSKPERIEDEEKSKKLKIWKSEEKGARSMVYKVLKNYITALRAYYEMLLEHEEDNFVLPKKHESRTEIKIRNRFLKIIDTFHQASEAAKAAHHEQGKKRIRKGEKQPYVAHEIRAASGAIFDVLPHIAEKRDLPVEMISLTILCSIHDVTEDTDLEIDDIITDFVERLLDSCDSSLVPFIKPGFEEQHLEQARKERSKSRKAIDEERNRARIRQLFREKTLQLITKERSSHLKRGLRIVTKDTRLRNYEKRRAFKSNIAGRKKTKELLDINEGEIAQWKLKKQPSRTPQSETFKRFPKEYDEGKMARFLIRLTTISKSKNNLQIALITKIEDRADNLSTQRKMSEEFQLRILRATSTRLVTWCMLDHNREQTPLYHALPRLIDRCVREYEYLQKRKTELSEEDENIYKQLIQWQKEIEGEQLKLPEHFKHFLRANLK